MSASKGNAGGWCIKRNSLHRCDPTQNPLTRILTRILNVGYLPVVVGMCMCANVYMCACEYNIVSLLTVVPALNRKTGGTARIRRPTLKASYIETDPECTLVTYCSVCVCLDMVYSYACQHARIQSCIPYHCSLCFQYQDRE